MRHQTSLYNFICQEYLLCLRPNKSRLIDEGQFQLVPPRLPRANAVFGAKFKINLLSTLKQKKNERNLRGVAQTWLILTKRFTNLKVRQLYQSALPKRKSYGRIGANMQLIFIHIPGISILLSVHHNFWGSERLQGTNIDALNPFSSKLMTLTLKGGL